MASIRSRSGIDSAGAGDRASTISADECERHPTAGPPSLSNSASRRSPVALTRTRTANCAEAGTTSASWIVTLPRAIGASIATATDEAGRGEQQLEVTGAGQDRLPFQCAVVVDQPMGAGVEMADDHASAVAAGDDLLEDRMGERRPGTEAQALVAGGPLGHADVAPHAVVQGDDAQPVALAGERVQDCVGSDVCDLPRRSEGRARGGHEDEQARIASGELGGEHRRTARLDADDLLDVLGCRQTDQAIAQRARSVDRAVDASEALDRAIEGGDDVVRTAEVGDDHLHVDTVGLELGQAPQALARRLPGAVGAQPGLAVDGQGTARRHDEVGAQPGDVRRQLVPDRAEAAGDDVGAAGHEWRWLVDLAQPAHRLQHRDEPPFAAPSHDPVAVRGQQLFGDGVGRCSVDVGDVDEQRVEIGVLVRGHAGDAERHGIGWASSVALDGESAASDDGESVPHRCPAAEPADDVERRPQPELRRGVDIERARRAVADDEHRIEVGQLRRSGIADRGRIEPGDVAPSRSERRRDRGRVLVAILVDDPPPLPRSGCGRRRRALVPTRLPPHLGRLVDADEGHGLVAGHVVAGRLFLWRRWVDPVPLALERVGRQRHRPAVAADQAIELDGNPDGPQLGEGVEAVRRVVDDLAGVAQGGDRRGRRLRAPSRVRRQRLPWPELDGHRRPGPEGHPQVVGEANGVAQMAHPVVGIGGLLGGDPRAVQVRHVPRRRRLQLRRPDHGAELVEHGIEQQAVGRCCQRDQRSLLAAVLQGPLHHVDLGPSPGEDALVVGVDDGQGDAARQQLPCPVLRERHARASPPRCPRRCPSGAPSRRPG